MSCQAQLTIKAKSSDGYTSHHMQVTWQILQLHQCFQEHIHNKFPILVIRAHKVILTAHNASNLGHACKKLPTVAPVIKESEFNTQNHFPWWSWHFKSPDPAEQLQWACCRAIPACCKLADALLSRPTSTGALLSGHCCGWLEKVQHISCLISCATEIMPFSWLHFYVLIVCRF